MEISELNYHKFFPTGTVTYSFFSIFDGQLPAEYADNDPWDINRYAGTYLYEFTSSFSSPQEAWTVEILTDVARMTGLDFDPVSDNSGTMMFGNASLYHGPDPNDPNTTTTVRGLAPGIDVQYFQLGPNDARIGDVWLYQGNNQKQFRETVVHEIGHALGLSHAHHDINPGFSPDEQALQFTVMGYKKYRTAGWADVALGFQLYDIAAIQEYYGQDFETHNKSGKHTNDTYGYGDTTNDFRNSYVSLDGGLTLSKNQVCIWDNGGIDTLSAAGAPTEAIIDLREGRFSSIVDETSYNKSVSADNISIAFGSAIEDAIGSEHDDLIIGNCLNNMLDGGAASGNDIIFGSGNIDDSGDGGYLTARNSDAANYSYHIHDDSSDPDYGKNDNNDSGDDLLFGRDGNDKLWGGEGHDILIGGADGDRLHGEDDKSGGHSEDQRDYLDGGAGADNFYVSEGDVIVNLDGSDSVYYNGSLLIGGVDYYDFLTHDHQETTYDGISFQFVGIYGESYGFFSYSADDGGSEDDAKIGLAILLPDATKPVLIYDIEYEVTDTSLYYDVKGDTGYLVGADIEVNGGLFTFRDWHEVDTNGTDGDEETAHVPQYAKDAYLHQIEDYTGESYLSQIAGFPDNTNFAVTTDTYETQITLEILGYSFETRTWDEDQLKGIWRASTVETGSNTTDHGLLITPDTTNHADVNGAPIQLGAPMLDVAMQFNAAASLITPLVLDLDSDGVELTSLAQSKAYFDLDANGFAQRTGWVTGGDGLLAIDTNGNGDIDDVNELFGATEPYGEATTNGFDALANLDSNEDGKIDASDDKFADLRVWIDADEDGFTDTGELKTLNEVGIESISLSTTTLNTTIAGNIVSDIAEYTKIGGGTGTVADAWLANSTLDTVDVRDATIPAAAMLMPALRGYGEVGGLRLEMSRNLDLLREVSDLALYQQRHEGTLPADMLARIGAIIVQWTGATAAESRGDNIDPQHLMAMERLTGTPFFQDTGPEGPNPGPNAAAVLESAWDDLVLSIGARILVQSVLEPAFPDVTYEWATDSFGGTLDSAAAVAALAELAPSGASADAYAFWKLGIATLDEVADDLEVDQGDYNTALETALANAGFDITADGLRDLTVRAADGDAFTGNENVVVFGGDGFDNIRTGAGDDRLFGGAGDDNLNGQTGSDIYIFDKESDHDRIVDADSNVTAVDRLQLAVGIVPDDVLFARNGDDLVVRVAGSNTEIVVEGQFADSDHGIEQIKFADGTIWNRAFIEGLAILGTEDDDTLTGTDNNDFIDGQTGADEMAGGKGSDTYAVDDEGDVVTEEADEGTDLVQSSISYALSANVEGLVLISGDIDGTGNALDNFLIGNDGDNALDGGDGADLLVGGRGNDTYIVDDSADRVVEVNYDFGYDTIQASLSWVLSADVEELVLTGTSDIDGTGNADDNKLTGNDGENTLSGGAGSDTLDGGAGNDTLIGGADDDAYLIGDSDDVIVEEEFGGHDAVIAAVNYVLSANVEDLTLTGSASISGTGNASNNVITGNSGNNQLSGGTGNDSLDGGNGNDTLDGDDGTDTLQGGGGNDTVDGGAGEDFLYGGDGNDTYVVDDAKDHVTEFNFGGTDNVFSSVTYTIGDFVENLTLTGSGNINGTGNGSANTLTGNSGDNILSDTFGNDTLDGGDGNDTLQGGNNNDTLLGGSGNDLLQGGADNDQLDGGTGIDDLQGGAGNDTYYVDDAADAITEAANEGTDTVNASVSYTLSANVETLVLTGTGNIDGTGSSGANTITGNSGDNVLDGAGGNDVLEGGDGNDTYLFGYGSGQDQVKDIVGGATPVDVLSLAAGVDVEDVNVSKSGTSLFIRLAGSNDRVEILNYFSGGGNGVDKIHFDGGTNWDRTFIDGLFITGSAGNDTLTGNGDNNWINGNGGTDKMSGGAGSDYYVVDSSSDTVTENTNEGYDVIESSVAIATLANNVEGLILSTGNINGTGNGLDNRIIGSTGNNTLNGGTGDDLLIGGAGNDTYVVDSTGDQTLENAGEGTDLVQSTVNWTLSEAVENLTLSGSSNLDGTGNSAANAITGNTGVNTLTGLGGDDTLDGGTGNDTLVGGLGNDTYLVDNTNDVVTEADNEGVDLVKSTATYTLSAYVDNLTLTGTSAIDGTGNAIDNIITGNTGINQLAGDAGNDTLDGGSNADKLTGGTGNDTYIVDNASDQVIENADEGFDLVKSSVSLTLALNVEDLTLTGTALNGTGNALDNVITGNGSANQLTGGDGNDTLDGGTNGDKLTGGLGNDTYLVDSGSDQVIENASEGTDHVKSSISYTLGTDLENLTLTGSGNINGTGNDADNVITGNFGNNNLQGGLGNDTINGDDGNDTLAGQGGTDALLGGAGNDVLTWDSDDTLAGGANRDTVLLSGSGTFDLDTAKVSGIEAINLGVADDNDNGIVLSLADVLDLASTGSGSFTANDDTLDLVIYGDNTTATRDNVDLTGGWTSAGTFSTSVLTGSSITFDVYQAGGVQVAVQQGLDLNVA